MEKSDFTSALRGFARSAIEKHGCSATNIIGRGRPENAFLELRGAYEGKCAVRTAKNGWFAFPWMTTDWGTLPESDYVLVPYADHDDPARGTKVYFFQADKLKPAFDAARAARIAAGKKVSDKTGMWVALHSVPGYLPTDTGFERLADWVEEFAPHTKGGAKAPPKAALDATPNRLSIAQAKQALAAYYDVSPEAVEITIRG
ncbi:MAG: hypothetical protein EON59_14510 [Alphaproteobacteria bacterium]|nr:MAG: hypothetical protein EON59_14510 [Alphaproteobacteria bacterium]